MSYNAQVTDARPLFLLLLAVFGVVAVTKQQRRPVVVVNQLPAHGMAVSDEDLKIVSWDLWMTFAPKAIQLSREEVGDDPHAIAENVFRRLFPDRVWPPPEDSPLEEKWDEIVRAIGKAIGKPVRPRLEVMA